MLTNTTNNNKKGKEMRKKTMRMMVIAGAVAMLLPTAAMAEWDQSESHNNQDPHGVFINVDTLTNTVIGDFSYDSTSPIGYEYKAGLVNMATNSPYGVKGQAPWNTTPCPIQLANNVVNPTWEAAMGNCPAQIQSAGWTQGGTDAAWGEGDNEMFGPILDDLYQSLTETASSPSNENGEKAFKKVDQVLDILFYRGNTVGEVYGTEGWTDASGIHWFGGLGIDQTLDQDVADIEGTTGNVLGAAHGTWLWNYDHVAQTFYQDFQLFDKYNQTGGVGDVTGDGNVNYPGADYVALGGSGNTEKYKRGQSNPRTRHGIEILVWAGVSGEATYDTTQDPTGYPLTPGWGEVSTNTEDFAFFDQWVIQSLRDTYTQEYDGSIAAGYQTFTGSVALNQSYSSWMALGIPGVLCDAVNDDSANAAGECTYQYKKDGHAVNKSIAENASSHQTGDP